MRLATPHPKQRSGRTEQIILFRVSGQLFALSSSSVQEVRSVDSLAGSSTEISLPALRKVRHLLQRGDKTLYVVNAAMHFGLPAASAGLVFVLRQTRSAVLVDGIDKMATMTQLQALPLAFCHEERGWYRGLTALDQSVIPVINPAGFLTDAEYALLDASQPVAPVEEQPPSDTPELPA